MIELLIVLRSAKSEDVQVRYFRINCIHNCFVITP